MFYNNETEYYPQPYGQEAPDSSAFESWGHFSQIVWSRTSSVGCYTYDCSPAGQPTTQDCNASGQPYLANTKCGPTGGTPAVFTVCNYYPEGKNPLRSSRGRFQCKTDQFEIGNIAGEYQAVKAPVGHGIVQMTENGLMGSDL